MSRMEHEFKIGIGIKELLKGDKREQEKFLKSIFKEDLKTEEYNDKIEYISINTDKWQFRYNILFYIIDTGKNGLYSHLSIKELEEHILEIENKLGLVLEKENWKIFSASWFNGGDEPCLGIDKQWLLEVQHIIK